MSLSMEAFHITKDIIINKNNKLIAVSDGPFSIAIADIDNIFLQLWR